MKHFRSMEESAMGYSQGTRMTSHSEIGYNTYQGYEKELVNENSTLQNRMKAQCDKIHDRDVLNPQLLKKYISYARHTVFPKLSMEACSVIKDFYIQLRENAINSQNTLPITSRTLDSLIRLS